MDTKILSLTTKKSETRTTCTLTQEGVTALKCLSEVYGFKQKMIFDLLFNEKWLFEGILAKAEVDNKLQNVHDIRKSLVISKKNMKFLNDSSVKSGIPRDVIVDTAFKNLVVFLNHIKTLQNEKYEKTRNILNNFCEQALVIEKDFDTYLSDDDPIKTRFSTVIVVISNLINDISGYLDNNTPIDPERM
jgi:hypothetical protein